MTIIQKKPGSKPQIDLRGPDGNAYVLLGTARKLAKQMRLDSAHILQEMQSSDYENLINVFDKHFGEVVDLVR